jgi:hypothetical protein
LRAWHLRNAGRRRAVFLWRKTKEEFLSFNIPCPTALVLPNLSHISSHHHKKKKNPFNSHFPIYLGTKGISTQ